MGITATAKNIRIAPQKARLVADTVRGQKVETAIVNLSFMPKKAARVIEKLLKSAVAAADEQGQLDVDTLIVKTIMVNEGKTMRRFRPRAQGRATRIRKRSSHIIVTLDEKL